MPSKENATLRTWTILTAAVIVCLCVAVIGIRPLMVRGRLTPIRVSGNSMASALHGETWCLRCADCQFLCRYDAAHPPTDERVICPNCGFANTQLDAAEFQRGDRVLLDPWTYRLRLPRRWELVAFPAVEDPEQLTVKRVIGLPGEKISIRDGEIYADGRIQRKSLDQLREVAVLVHDHRYQPQLSADLPPRWRAESPASGWTPRKPPKGGTTNRGWQAESPASGWTSVQSGFVYRPPAETAERLDWLEYCNWRCFDHPTPRSEPCPVLDHLGENQELSRQLNPVGDLMLACRLQVRADRGRLTFRIHDGSRWLTIDLDWAATSARVLQADRLLATKQLPSLAYPRGVEMILATCDAQLLFEIDGRTLFREPLEPTLRTTDFRSRPIAIGVSETRVCVDQLRVYRDLYYLDPQGLSRPWSISKPLGGGHYFVLGDNVAISRDSRHGNLHGVQGDRLLGRVIRR